MLIFSVKPEDEQMKIMQSRPLASCPELLDKWALRRGGETTKTKPTTEERWKIRIWDRGRGVEKRETNMLKYLQLNMQHFQKRVLHTS